jgi:hypothetical protein
MGHRLLVIRFFSKKESLLRSNMSAKRHVSKHFNLVEPSTSSSNAVQEGAPHDRSFWALLNTSET